jgi:hypothetical protein
MTAGVKVASVSSRSSCREITVAVAVEANLSEAATAATFAVEAAAAVAGVGRFADNAIVVVFGGKQFRHSLIKAIKAICTYTSRQALAQYLDTVRRRASG